MLYNIISIHALVKRATHTQEPLPYERHNFNPRPREEGDDSPHFGQFVVNLISIHALVKRATVCRLFK